MKRNKGKIALNFWVTALDIFTILLLAFIFQAAATMSKNNPDTPGPKPSIPDFILKLTEAGFGISDKEMQNESNTSLENIYELQAQLERFNQILLLEAKDDIEATFNQLDKMIQRQSKEAEEFKKPTYRGLKNFFK